MRFRGAQTCDIYNRFVICLSCDASVLSTAVSDADNVKTYSSTVVSHSRTYTPRDVIVGVIIVDMKFAVEYLYGVGYSLKSIHSGISVFDPFVVGYGWPHRAKATRLDSVIRIRSFQAKGGYLLL